MMQEMERHPLWPEFQEYHAANPDVYVGCRAYARKYKEAGKSRVGIHLLIERVRWELSLDLRTEDEFKIPNGFKPLYARLLVLFEPDIADMFELRSLTSLDDD